MFPRPVFQVNCPNKKTENAIIQNKRMASTQMKAIPVFFKTLDEITRNEG